VDPETDYHHDQAGVKKKKAKTWEEYERQQQSKTCLDGDVGAQAILEAAGRTNYSAGSEPLHPNPPLLFHSRLCA